MIFSRFFRPEFLGSGSVALFGLSQFITIALYPALSSSTNISLSEIIISFTLGSLLFIWSSPYWATRSDVLGRIKVLALGLFGLSFSTGVLVFLVMKNFSNFSSPVLIASRVVYGLTASAIVPVVQAWWKDQEPNSVKGMLKHSMSLNIGRMLAPVFVLTLMGSLEYILLTVTVLSLILSLLCLFDESENETHIDLKVSDTNEKKDLLLFVLLSTTFVGIIHSLLAENVRVTLMFSEEDTTMMTAKILLFSGLIVLLIQSTLRKFDHFSGTTLVILGSLSFLASGILFINAKSVGDFWFFISLLSFGLALIVPGYLSFVSRGGKAAGVVSSCQTIGLCLGGFLSSLVLKEYLSLGLVFFFLFVPLLSFPVAKSLQRRAHV